MAETSLKRLLPDDSLQDGESAQKKIRSNNGSPAPIPTANAANKPDVSKIMADARARAAAVAARLKAGTNGVTPAPPLSSYGAASSASSSKLEQIKARVAATMAKTSGSSDQRSGSLLSPTARGGLGTQLHPALMDNTAQEFRPSKSKQAVQSKADQTSKAGKAKKQLDLSLPDPTLTRNQPFFDASLGSHTATLKARNRRELAFNAKGKYIQQGAALRRQRALEEMKMRIAATSKKALEKGDPSEKNFIILAPPEIEWWDENIVKGKDYGSVGDDGSGFDMNSPDSIITRYVQHPVLLEPPSVNQMPAPRPMFLTPKEQAKLRRQKRMENLKEHQTKVRLGLLPPDPPKVKLKNMMRVLGEDAVKDPTAVEAKVNREIAERSQKHNQMNEDRKLTKEEKNEKLEQKKTQDAAKGIYLSVYKIDSLANGRHLFKVNKNAEQMSGTGLCLSSPAFSLVLFESGEHSVKAYKKLMLNRIDWTENSIPAVREGNQKARAAWLESLDAEGNLKDLSANKITLLFEGQQKDRAFRKWGSKSVESDKEAMDVLARAKMENFWTQAKSMP
ncbi:putative U4/U6 small nuclear ribonucleoprotein [Usnea florida]